MNYINHFDRIIENDDLNDAAKKIIGVVEEFIEI